MPIQKTPVVRVVRKRGNAGRPPMTLSLLIYCSDDDEEDETAELLRELEKIKKERSEKQAEEVHNPDPYRA